LDRIFIVTDQQTVELKSMQVWAGGREIASPYSPITAILRAMGFMFSRLKVSYIVLSIIVQ
jgi:hypothetical protein